MKHIRLVLSLFLLIGILSSNVLAQYNFKYNYGFIQDFYKLESDGNSPFITGWEKFSTGNGFDGELYSTLEFSYSQKNDVYGIRFDFTKFFVEYCYSFASGKSCNSFSGSPVFNGSLFYGRSISLSKKISFIPSVGIGIRSFTDFWYLNDTTKLLGTGGLTSESGNEYLKAVDSEYINPLTWHIPLDLKLDYKFNKFLHFNFNIGYDHTINDYIHRIDIEYSQERDFTNTKNVVVKNGRYGYVGLGIGVEINDKKPKTSEDLKQ